MAGDNGMKIRTIDFMPNERTRFDTKSALGLLRFDISCKCTCWKENNKHDPFVFDIEMQRAFETGFTNRLSEYAGSLQLAHNIPVVVLAFLNYKRGDEDQSLWIASYYVNEETREIIKPVSDSANTHAIDLARKSFLLNANSSIYINGLEI